MCIQLPFFLPVSVCLLPTIAILNKDFLKLFKEIFYVIRLSTILVTIFLVIVITFNLLKVKER